MGNASVLQPAKAPLSREMFFDGLVKQGLISREALERVRRVYDESGESLCKIVTKLGLMSEDALAKAQAVALSLPLTRISQFPNKALFEDKLSRKFLKYALVLPLEDRADGLAVAMADPWDEFAVDAMEFVGKKPILRFIATQGDIEEAIDCLYGQGAPSVEDTISETEFDPRTDDLDDVERLQDYASEAPVIRLVNLLIARAVEARASDIHLEPLGDRLRIRYRIDGTLRDVDSVPRNLCAAVTSRVKILAKLNIAEKRRAQDGRIRLAVRGRDIDFRVSTNPTVHGESVVLRILDRTQLKLDFDALGFDGVARDAYQKLLLEPHGIVLVTGPTGSGKTTTLYASLNALNSPEKKILTVEDPIEYQLEGINQAQVNPKIGRTFATALRSLLRQDPDIIMVGEIRDVETARIAVQAALTGHIVFSTVHTNDAASAVIRLLDMGIEDFLLASTINGIVGQRLVRTLCRKCREPFEPTAEMIMRLSLRRFVSNGPIKLYRARGCTACGGTGYFGRTCIIEVLVVTDAIRNLVIAKPDIQDIRGLAVTEGMQTMYAHGLEKVVAGLTTLEEIFRVTKEA